MGRSIEWRLHCRAPCERIFQLLTTDEGRERFWAERSVSLPDGFRLHFPDGTVEQCTLLEQTEPSRFRFRYFGAEVEVALAPDAAGGTDLRLTARNVPDEECEEVKAGWVSVLLPLKAAADFGIDLRNHDPSRTWRELYVDQ